MNSGHEPAMKKPKLPKPKKVRRNPHARALASPLFRARAVKGPDSYRRRPKHRRPVAGDDEA
jgi:stalled ribosome alternative rescue factor ArfA